LSSDSLWDEIAASLTAQTGCGSINPGRALSGGSINRACHVKSEDGQHFFIKLNCESDLSMFEAERDGLQELAGSEAIRVPAPIVCGAGQGGVWLVTEFIEFGHAIAGSEQKLGEQLAAMHRHTTDYFGWFRDNTIGSTPQLNRRHHEWVEFYSVQRLKYQFDLAARNGYGGQLQQKGERLMAGLSAFFTDYRPEASLLHGDLWGGNRGFDRAGEPVIFDPAVYYGDREADIAMTELFGGFGRDFYAGYNAAWALDPGYKVRKHLYNLYHILNHANLFGGGYASQAGSMLDRLLSEI